MIVEIGAFRHFQKQIAQFEGIAASGVQIERSAPF
jgi:hypothetical protein